jgi:hypothetical protein
VQLEIRIDAESVPSSVPKTTVTLQHDHPISYDPTLRQYGYRSVALMPIDVENPDSRNQEQSVHDPMAALGGA